MVYTVVAQVGHSQHPSNCILCLAIQVTARHACLVLSLRTNLELLLLVHHLQLHDSAHPFTTVYTVHFSFFDDVAVNRKDIFCAIIGHSDGAFYIWLIV